jgi:hypothetical protein
MLPDAGGRQVTSELLSRSHAIASIRSYMSGIERGEQNVAPMSATQVQKVGKLLTLGSQPNRSQMA